MFVVLLVMFVLDRTPIGTAQSERPSAIALEAGALFSVVSDFGSAELAEKYLPNAFAMPPPSGNRLCVAEIK